jgi:hypothetical protein
LVSSRAEASAFFAPYEADLVEVISAAWEDYQAHEPLKHRHSARSRASIVHDNMVHHVKRVFEDVPEVTFVERRGLFMLNFEDIFVLRFKKLDDRMLSSNIPTQQALGYVCQLALPGMPAATKLQAGYQLDRSQTAIRAMLLTCPAGSSLYWFLELTPQEPQELPVPDSTGPVAPPSTGRIRLKSGVVGKDAAASSGS